MNPWSLGHRYLSGWKEKLIATENGNISFYHFLKRYSRNVASSATSNCAMAFVS